MNNITTVDSVRAVVTDKNVTQPDSSDGAAKSGAQHGKTLPVQAQAQAAAERAKAHGFAVPKPIVDQNTELL